MPNSTPSEEAVEAGARVLDEDGMTSRTSYSDDEAQQYWFDRRTLAMNESRACLAAALPIERERWEREMKDRIEKLKTPLLAQITEGRGDPQVSSIQLKGIDAALACFSTEGEPKKFCQQTPDGVRMVGTSGDTGESPGKPDLAADGLVSLSREELVARLAPEMYYQIKREPVEGTVTDAIKCHSQACGFVAYALNLTPDQVAQEVSLNDVTNGKTNEGTNE